jgi:hypothetical protein
MSKRGPNYNSRLLLEVIRGILPAGADAWQRVAETYQVRSGEANLRDKDDVKRHFNQKMCMNNKKPTSGTQDHKELVKDSQEVHRLILSKFAAEGYGSENSSDESDNDYEEEQESVENGETNDNNQQQDADEVSDVERQVGSKRHCETIKNKNTRKKPRAGAANALNKLADSFENTNILGCMQMMMQQQQNQMQQMQQANQQMMMMMMRAISQSNNIGAQHSFASPSSSSSSSSSSMSNEMPTFSSSFNF